ncbi:oxidoreductase, short chain dehydrogenase/reductase family [Verrucomicrobiia bacterium DG1235]|nr:oxidoreductase, short chain dehydrogenase/reductase family [Verrucomicrobiae bacterium DG1235]
MKISLSGKWALVTGSTRGIGQQIALGLARCGANVIVHGRSEAAAAQTVELLAELPVSVEVVAGELSSVEGVESIIEQVKAKVGVIDILYNNAAISHEGQSIFEQSRELWDRVFQVNVHALIRLCQAFAPGMQERKWGRIVNLTSGIADQPDLAVYSVSKAAVDKFSRDLSTAVKDDNVLVNYVDPGWLKTDLGGPDAWDEVTTVLPGALVPVLLPDGGPTGRHYAAQDYKVLGE